MNSHQYTFILIINLLYLYYNKLQMELVTLNKFGRFYQKIKPLKKLPNVKCAICGTKHRLTVHHIVPRFIGSKIEKDEFLKCRTVVVCTEHHEEYELIVEKLKDELAQQYNFNFRGPNYVDDPYLAKIKRYARSLICGMNFNSQEAEIFHRRDVILSYLSQPSYTSNDLYKLSEMNTLKQNPAVVDLANFFIDKFGGFNGVKEFWYNHWDSYVEKRTCFIG